MAALGRERLDQAAAEPAIAAGDEIGSAGADDVGKRRRRKRDRRNVPPPETAAPQGEGTRVQAACGLYRLQPIEVGLSGEPVGIQPGCTKAGLLERDRSQNPEGKRLLRIGRLVAAERGKRARAEDNMGEKACGGKGLDKAHEAVMAMRSGVGLLVHQPAEEAVRAGDAARLQGVGKL